MLFRSVALRFLVAGLPPAFVYRRLRRLSQGIAFSSRVTLMVRPLLLAEPGPGDASCTIWTLSVFVNPICFQAGRPSSRFAFSSLPVFRPSPVLQPFPTLRSSLVFRCFRSFDHPRSYNRFRPPDLLQFSACFRSFDLRQPSNRFRLFHLPRSFDRVRFPGLLQPSTDSNLSIFSGF